MFKLYYFKGIQLFCQSSAYSTLHIAVRVILPREDEGWVWCRGESCTQPCTMAKLQMLRQTVFTVQVNVVTSKASARLEQEQSYYYQNPLKIFACTILTTTKMLKRLIIHFTSIKMCNKL